MACASFALEDNVLMICDEIIEAEISTEVTKGIEWTS
jgi:hypothetical protein